MTANRKLPISLFILVLFTFIFPFGCSYSSDAITRNPYLQSASSNSIVIKWRTNHPSPSIVTFGKQVTALNDKVENATFTTEHEIKLENLDPNTQYFYSIQTKDYEPLVIGDEYSFFTHPPVGDPKDLRIWALGDSGTGTLDAARVFEGYNKFAAKTGKANLWLMLGDNAYESGLDAEYQKGVFTTYVPLLRNTVLWPTYGNHDGRSAKSSDMTGPYYNNFALPQNGESGGTPSHTEAYYSFDYGDVHFICLNSYDVDRKKEGVMAKWLQEDMRTTKAKWLIAYWHHPAYSKGSHDSDTEIELKEMRENIVPILEENGIDLVLEGHSHGYERSFLMDGHYGDSSTLTDKMKIDGSTGTPPNPYRKPLQRTPHSGAVYVVSGTGASVHPPLSHLKNIPHPAMKVVQYQLGSLVIDKRENRLTVQQINTEGDVSDSFEIVKE